MLYTSARPVLKKQPIKSCQKLLNKKSEELTWHAWGRTRTSACARARGFFEQNFNTFDQAKSNLRNLLLTKKGERFLQPEFGSGLQSLLFEPIDETFETRVSDTITESVSQWLPYITIDDIFIDISDSNKDRNKVGVEIKFKVGETLDLQTVTFTLGT